MLGQNADMNLWRRAVLAIAARFFSLDSRGFKLMINWQAVDNDFALIFVMGEFVLALFRDQQMTYVISSQFVIFFEVPGIEVTRMGHLL